MKFMFSRMGAMAALILGLGLPTAAQANTSESDWSLTSSLNTSAYDADKTLVFNVRRCEDLFDISTGEVSFVYTLDKTNKLSSSAKFSVKFANGSQACSNKKLERDSSEECENIVNNQPLSASTGPITVKLKASKLSSATSADMCENLAETSYIYLIVNDSSALSENIYNVTYVLDFRTKRPAAPSSLSAEPGGSSIELSWDAVDSAASYNIYYTSDTSVAMAQGQAPEDVNADTMSISKTSATLKDHIDEETDYKIGITAVDSVGNESLMGPVVDVTTLSSNDFWETYRAENADVDGGFCFIATAAWGSTQEPHVALLRKFRDNILLTNAPGRAFVDTYYRLSPPLAHFIGQHPTARAITRTLLWPVYGMAYLALNAPVVLAGIFLLFCFGIAMLIRRKRQKKIALASKSTAAAVLLASALCVTAPSDAFALDSDDESPVNMMVELKAGPYTPDKLGSAFKKHFSDNSGFLLEGEYDWQFWRGVGSLGLGFHFGYGNITGKAIDNDGNTTVDETSIHWLPFRLSLVYRFDYLWQRFNVPLTIYVKGGFDYYIWFVENASGDIPSAGGKKGYGGTFGFHAVAGLAFVLDWISPSMAKAFDVEWGVNNSYLFAEYMYANINNFYAGGAFDLTENATFQIGLGLEF